MSEFPVNQYYVYLHPGREPVPWYPPDPHPLDWVDYTYFGKVFEAMEKYLQREGLIVYFTWDRVNELPSYGDNVVVVVAGDEWSRIPKYVDRVKAIFKCHPLRPILGYHFWLRPSYLNFLTLVQFIRLTIIHVPNLVAYLVALARVILFQKTTIAPVFPIPLGYSGDYADLPIKEIEKREYDIFFAGSVEHGSYPIWSLKRWARNPKILSRQEMIATLERLRKKYPEYKLELATTSSFATSGYSVREDYWKKMMDTKICLVPRGTSWETFRLYEGLKYGCVLITEVLSSHWFHENAPTLQIDNWNELETLLPKLLDDKSRLQEKHRESLHWWKTRCSEESVGRYMADKLNALIDTSRRPT